MKSRMQPKAARGGKALLEGLVRCRHCGRMLHISYSRTKGTAPRYHCKGAHVNHGEDWCISFGGVRVDEAVAQELLRAITGNTIEAAVNAAEKLQKHRGEQRSMLDLEPEQARYEAKLAARRYEAVDPENRLVASDLEARWNGSLQKVEEIEKRLLAFDSDAARPTIPDGDLLMSLAHDLPTVWQSMSNMRLKQRIVHILIKEIVADIDEQRREVVLLIHRAGGQHSQLKVRKKATGQHNRRNSLEAIEVVRRMADTYSDEQIAATLNRTGLRTGVGNTWSEQRVYALRRSQHLQGTRSRSRDVLTLEQAAEILGVSATCVRHMIERKIIPATQVVDCAPWEIPAAAVNDDEVRRTVLKTKARGPRQRVSTDDQQALFNRS